MININDLFNRKVRIGWLNMSSNSSSIGKPYITLNGIGLLCVKLTTLSKKNLLVNVSSDDTFNHFGLT